MAKTDELHQLIHSLSKTEKRYFKVYSGKNDDKESKKFLELFDLVNKQKSYDPIPIKHAIPNLPPTKTKLITSTLKAMRSFHSGRESQVKLADLIFNAKFLRSIKMYPRSMKELQKALNSAYKLEKWTVLLEALQIKRMILKETQAKGYATQLNQLRNERRDIMNNIQAESDYQDLVDPLLVMIREDRLTGGKESLDNKLTGSGIEIKLLNDPNLASTFDSKTNFYFANFLYQQLKGNAKLAHQFLEQLVTFWEERPVLRKESIYRYKVILSNYLNSCHAIERYELFPDILAKIKEITARSPDEEAEDFQNLKYLELLYFINTTEWDAAFRLVNEISRGLKQYSEKINFSRKLAFYHNLFVLHFVRGKFKSAKNWIDKVPTDKNIPAGRDVQNFSLVARLVVIYEIEGFVDDNLLRSTKRRLQRRKAYGTIEKLIISLMDKLMASPLSMGEKELFVEFHSQASPIRNQMIGTKELLFWAESKIKGITIQRVLDLVAGG